MVPFSIVLLYLLPLSGATSTNTTTTGCPSCDAGTSCNYRSIWSLLAGCGLTLLICVWHAVHPSVPLPQYKYIDCALYRLNMMLVAFFTPEIMIGVACAEWWEARQITGRVRDRGHKWWTMTHTHFILSGGFVLRDDTAIREINIDKFLSLVEADELVNPVVMEEDIKDKSTSDALGKALLIVQLSWFTTQITVRLVNHLAVTLVELDTVCMALLTIPLIYFWWKKPHCPGRPHFFYMRDVNNRRNQETLQGDNVTEKLLDNSRIETDRDSSMLLTPVDSPDKFTLPTLLTWAIFGALHAIAWNYEFPTEIEKTLWRISSLTLVGMPVIFAVALMVVASVDTSDALDKFTVFFVFCAVICRLLLVVLMLASLRSLPSSAYQIISWTSYIPHL